MISGLTLLAALGVLAAAAAPACGTIRTFALRSEAVGKLPVDSSASRAPSVAARLCLVLSCLFALAAYGTLWLSQGGPESPFEVPHPVAWGALWIHVLVLLVEWRRIGLPDAGRRTLAGLLLAGAGVLFLGLGLTAWTNTDASAGAACVVGPLANDTSAWVVRAAAGLGLALVPLAGIALGLNRAADPPLSAAAASVAIAAWLQPALPALGWLPASVGAGAALAGLLVAALMVLGVAASRGPRVTAGGVVGYFALTVGGCTILGILREGSIV